MTKKQKKTSNKKDKNQDTKEATKNKKPKDTKLAPDLKETILQGKKASKLISAQVIVLSNKKSTIVLKIYLHPLTAARNDTPSLHHWRNDFLTNREPKTRRLVHFDTCLMPYGETVDCFISTTHSLKIFKS